jgi:hypothetical protein
MDQIDKSGAFVPEKISLSPSSANSALIDLLNVKYVLAPEEQIGPGWTRVYDAETRIYQRINPWPRAWLAAAVETLPTAQAMLQRMTTSDFDPAVTVLLEESTPGLSSTASGETGTVHFDEYQPNRLVLTVDMLRPGWLVLSENYYPGWTVRVDGQSGKIYRADYLFRAVPLTAGIHQIEMIFQPVSFISGALVSLITLSMLVFLGAVTWKLERPRA